MPFTANDFHDLVRLLAEHPEWRADLRRLVLSEELLGLPDLMHDLAHEVRELAAAQQRAEERLARVEEGQARLEARQDRLEAAMAALVEAQQRTDQQLAALTAAQQRTDEALRALTERVDALAAAQQRTEEQLAALAAAQRGSAGSRIASAG
ncbi:MAG: hypothetical protein HYU88_11840 [Chloroflexi bacterium]|nr:hypothetical protein [Chloroflexota bacterium]